MQKAYTSDLTDAHWQRIEPSIPPARTGKRNRTLDMRQTVNALLYLLRNGCSWRDLPVEVKVTAANVFGPSRGEAAFIG